jgi:hypothetical protein
MPDPAQVTTPRWADVAVRRVGAPIVAIAVGSAVLAATFALAYVVVGLGLHGSASPVTETSP